MSVEAKKVHPLSKEAREQRKTYTKEEETEKTVEEIYGLSPIEPHKQYEFVAKRGSGFISNRCLVYDPVENRKRWLRYIPEEESVFEDEQDTSFHPAGEESSEYAIPVPNDRFEISGLEKNKVLFLLLHGRRTGNEKMAGTTKKEPLFRYVDYDVIDKANRQRQEAEFEAYKVANGASYEEILPYAYVLGIDVSRGEDYVRFKFVDKAKESPLNFLKEFNDPKHKRKFTILKAFERNLLTDHHIIGSVHWVSSLTKVIDIPAGETSIDYLVSYSFSAQGEKFFEVLLTLIDK